MTVAVLGAGPRGRVLTQWCVRAGHAVRLYDGDASAVMDSVDALDQTLDDVAVTDHVDGTTGLQSAVDGAEMVLDVTDHDTPSRRALLADVETMVDDDTLVATGDTTVSVTAVAAGLQTPNRAVGVYFPDPDASDVVEVALADQTTAETRDRATAFVRGLEGVPIVVRDSPGFAAARFGPPALLRDAVEVGRLGKSTGEGFYEWTNGAPTRPGELNPTVTARDGEFEG